MTLCDMHIQALYLVYLVLWHSYPLVSLPWFLFMIPGISKWDTVSEALLSTSVIFERNMLECDITSQQHKTDTKGSIFVMVTVITALQVCDIHSYWNTTAERKWRIIQLPLPFMEEQKLSTGPDITLHDAWQSTSLYGSAPPIPLCL